MAYAIVREPWGFRLRFSGFFRVPKIRQWLSDSLVQLAHVDGPFCVFVDMRGTVAMPPETQDILREGQEAFRRAGMVRSAVLVDEPIARLQIIRTAGMSGIAAGERVFDSSDPKCEEKAMAWLLDGCEP